MSCESATRVGLDSDRYAPSAQPNTDKRNHRKSVTFAWKPSTKVCNFRLLKMCSFRLPLTLIPIFEGHVCIQIGGRALTGPCGGGKEATREAQNRGPGLPRRIGLARSGPGAARAWIWIQVSAREHGIPLLDGVFPARTGNPNRRHRLRHAPDLGLATGR